MTEEKKEFQPHEVCKYMFLSRSDFIKVVYVVGGIMLAGSVSAVTWALAQTSSTSSLTTTVSELKTNYSDIDQKLDRILLHMGEKK
jgi:hypothetical protein